MLQHLPLCFLFILGANSDSRSAALLTLTACLSQHTPHPPTSAEKEADAGQLRRCERTIISTATFKKLKIFLKANSLASCRYQPSSFFFLSLRAHRIKSHGEALKCEPTAEACGSDLKASRPRYRSRRKDASPRSGALKQLPETSSCFDTSLILISFQGDSWLPSN